MCPLSQIPYPTYCVRQCRRFALPLLALVGFLAWPMQSRAGELRPDPYLRPAPPKTAELTRDEVQAWQPEPPRTLAVWEIGNARTGGEPGEPPGVTGIRLDIAPQQDFSVAFWFKANPFPTRPTPAKGETPKVQLLVADRDLNNLSEPRVPGTYQRYGQFGWDIGLNAAGNVQFNLSSVVSIQLMSGENHADGQWHHVVVAADREREIQLFVNGRLADSYQGGNAVPIAVKAPEKMEKLPDYEKQKEHWQRLKSIYEQHAVSIGADAKGNRRLDGMIEDVRIVNHEYTGDQVRALMGPAAPAVNPPQVNAGGDQVHPDNPVILLKGEITDARRDAPDIKTRWEKVRGMGNVFFEHPDRLETEVSFPDAPGIYILRLCATDGEYVVYDDVEITVGVNEVAERFFAEVNLDLPEMADIKKLVAAQNYYAALNVFRDYWVDALRPIADMNVSPTRLPMYHDVAKIMQNRWQWWKDGQTGRPEMDLGSPGHLDWTYVEKDKWDVQLWQNGAGNQWEMLIRMLIERGDPAYFDKWVEVWHDNGRNYETMLRKRRPELERFHGAAVWHDAVLWRVRNLPYQLAQAARYNSGMVKRHLSGIALAEMIMGVSEGMDRLLDNQVRRGNHGVLDRTNAIYAALALKPLKKSAEWVDKAARQYVKTSVDAQWYPDGGYSEYVWHYFDHAMFKTEEFLEVARRNLHPYPEWALELDRKTRMKARLKFTCITPAGFLVEICNAGSTWGGDRPYEGPDPAATVVNHGTVMRVTDMFPDPLIKQVKDAMWRNGPEPAFTSVSYPYQGYYNLRSSWQKDADFLFLKSSPIPSDKYHMDENAIQLVAFERSLLVDSGNFGQGAGGYTGSTFAHNSIAVDGQSQHVTAMEQHDGTPMREPLQRLLHHGEVFDYVVGNYDRAYINRSQIQDSTQWVTDVDHVREVTFLRKHGLYIVTDRLLTDGDHDYTQMWNFSPTFAENQVETDAAAKRIGTVDPDWANLEIRQFTPYKVEYTKYYGHSTNEEKDDNWEPGEGEFGWYGRKDGALPKVDVQAQWQGQGDQCVVSMLRPMPGMESGIVDMEDLTSETRRGFRADLEDGTEIFYLASVQGEKLQAGEHATAAAKSLLVVRAADQALNGIVTGAQELMVAGRFYELPTENFAFELRNGRLTLTPIRIPDTFDWMIDAQGDSLPVYHDPLPAPLEAKVDESKTASSFAYTQAATARQDVLEGLIHRWDFADAANRTEVKLHGNSSFVEDESFGQAVRFLGGANDFADLGACDTGAFDSQVTISFWAKAREPMFSYMDGNLLDAGVIQLRATPSQRNMYQEFDGLVRRRDPDGNVIDTPLRIGHSYAYLGFGFRNSNVLRPRSIDHDRWRHYTLVYETRRFYPPVQPMQDVVLYNQNWTSGIARLYIDGIYHHNGWFPGDMLPLAAPENATVRAGGRFAGQIADVRVYNRKLSHPEILTVMRAGFCSVGATPVGGQETTRETTLDFPGETSEWQGYGRHDFTVDAHPVTVVAPRDPAPGNPWVLSFNLMIRYGGASEEVEWSPGLFPALLEQGLHIVAFRGRLEPFGAPRNLEVLGDFIDHMTSRYSLAAKPVLAGLSRQALLVQRFAMFHPDRVAALYLDRGVCDFKSWPGIDRTGMWNTMKKDFGFNSDEEALAFEGNPVDQVEVLGKNNIPVFHVLAENDTIVPPEENGLLMQKRARELGYDNIRVAVEKGKGHNPHGMTDPKPLIEFLAKYGQKTAAGKKQ